MTGRVYLVGAGPGDPGLMTVRAQRCVAAADVIVHDELVPRRLLDGARPDAEIIGAGPMHGTGVRLDQRGIEALLVERARAGKTVVRLKNGDPMLFGRGAEEAEALRGAGVPFEVVPGVTSALAVPAFAGIPVTDRDRASLVTIVTGHTKCLRDGVPDLPWALLAKHPGTLVFLMAVRNLRGILDHLVAHGMAPDVPAAAIRHGTLAAQRVVVGTVGTLAAAASDLRPPAVVVIGDVVGMRAAIAWSEARPLAGRRIVVTRPRDQAADMVRRLEDLGADVVAFPTIAIVPPEDPAPLDRAVREAGTYDWLIFTSVNGVRTFFARMAAQRVDVRSLAGVRVAAIGPETAAELERRHVVPAVVPSDYRAEGLVDALQAFAVAGARVLLPRAAGARSVLPEALRARGAHVDDVVAYRSATPPDADVDGLRAALEAGAIDAVTFTSSSTVAHFVDLLGADFVRTHVAAGRPIVASIGPVTSGTARERGLPVAVEPSAYTVAALVDALVAHFCAPDADHISRTTV